MSPRMSSSAYGLADASLLEAMSAMAPADVRLGCRAIRVGDEQHLLPEERRLVTTHDPAARRASGAARHLARSLIADMGCPGVCIGRSAFGAPVWPEGIAGSLAHDDEIAVAAVGRTATLRSLGIDVEPAEPLPDDVFALVATGADATHAAPRHLAGRLLFAAKEAVYKAAHPLDGLILDYDDIAIDLTGKRARTRTGHVAELYFSLAPRVVVLAVVR